MAALGLVGDSHFFEENTSPAKVQQYLESAKESDKLKGMKWLLAMMSKGKGVSNFFPNVVKNVSVKSVEVKKMVYMYLVHHADADEECRNISLLSINSFQKDLGASSQFIRGLALRVMTSIRIPDIIQIQIFAIRKCASDSSPYVRKCAANAIAKIHKLDPEQSGQLKEVIDRLLRDSSTMVLGSAIVAFNDICPNDFDLIHRPFRKICHLLADLDEWCQTITMQVLTRYARAQFMDPSPGLAAAIRQQSRQIQGVSTSSLSNSRASKPKARRRVIKKGFYSDESDKSSEEEVDLEVRPKIASISSSSSSTGSDKDGDADMDPDHKLVLKSSLPLLKSRNTGVVLAVCGLQYYCGNQSASTASQVGRSMVRILRNNREVQYVVLSAINRMVQERPSIFRPFLKEFFVKPTDPVFSRLFKLDILSALVTRENVDSILLEMQTYLRHGNKEFVMAVVDAVSRIANAQSQVAVRCLDGLMVLCTASPVAEVVGRAMNGIRQIMQQIRFQYPEVIHQAIRQVAKFLLISSTAIAGNNDSGKEDGGIEIDGFGRAAMIWMMGEFIDSVAAVVPDISRLLVSGFVAEENSDVRLQIINLASKLGTKFPDDDAIQELVAYTLELGSFDAEIDIRDRSRFLIALLGMIPCGNASNEVNEGSLERLRDKSRNIILQPKAPPLTLLGPVALEALQYFDICSLSFVLGHPIHGYIKIPDWPEKRPDPTVRDAPVVVPSASVSRAAKVASTGAKKLQDSSDEEDDDEDEEESEPEDDDDEEEEEEAEKETREDETGVTEQENEDDDYLKSALSESNGKESAATYDYDFSGTSSSTTPKGNQASAQANPPRFRRAAAGKSSNFSQIVDLNPQQQSVDYSQAVLISATRPQSDVLLIDHASKSSQSQDQGLAALLDTSKKTNSADALEELLAKDPPSPVRHPSRMVVVAEDASNQKDEDYSMSTLKASLVPITLPPKIVERPPDSLLSPYVQMVRQELSWGLLVEYAFVRSGFDYSHTSLSSATSLFLSLRVTNRRQDKDSVNRFRLVFPSGMVASSSSRTPWIDIESIPANFMVEKTIELDLHGEVADEVIVDLRCNRGDCKGSMRATALDVCRPLMMAGSTEFERIVEGLSGIRESKVTLQLREEINSNMVNVMRSLGNFACIPSSKPDNICMSALLGSSTRIMVRVVLDRTNDVHDTHLHVYSDDGMMTSQLLAIIKKQLSK